MRQTSTKSAVSAIAIHRAQTKVIFESDKLDDSMKILVLGQLNIAIETLLQREKCYFGYIMPELTEDSRQKISLGLFEKVACKPEWFMHHYQARVKVSGDAHLQQSLTY